MTSLPHLYIGLDQFDAALDLLLRSLAIFQGIGYEQGEARALTSLQALAIRRQLGDRWGEAGRLRQLGGVYRDLGRFEDATDCYRQSLVTAREVRHTWGEAHSLDLLAAALQHVEGKEAARVYWEEALAIFTELGDSQADEVRAHLEESHEALQSNT